MPDDQAPADLVLSDLERRILRVWAERPSTTRKLAQRAWIVLACAEGQNVRSVAEQLGITSETVGQWRHRFLEQRLDGLTDRERSGTQAHAISADEISTVVTRTLETLPECASRWTTWRMAEATGLSQSTVSRIWRDYGLKPRLKARYGLANEPLFITRVRNVAGLYMNPPQRALALCIDEAGLPQAPGGAPTVPAPPQERPDDDRLSAPALLAALNVATGAVLRSSQRGNRARDFLEFLTELDAKVPGEPGVGVHLLVQNDASHETALVKKWFLNRPEYHWHVAPTGGSWLKLMDATCAEIQKRQAERGPLRSFAALVKTIQKYLEDHPRNRRHFVWTANAHLMILGRTRVLQGPEPASRSSGSS
jgi:transposase